VRIIGGTRRGLKLYPFAGREIRPTADRLRESLFNILGPIGAHCRVIDLFAGTGALGIEALSRGAATALFIDSDPQALSLVSRNLQRCRLADRARVIAWDIVKNLECLAGQPWRFDLVFMDPPYGRGLVATALTRLEKSRGLVPGALVVVEHATGEPLALEHGPFALEDCRCYGKTLVSFLRYMV
jgi:16S rRNA (guanine966-N2)-methyltransferase